MGELYQKLARSLKQAGCEIVRQGKGSHEIWRNPATGRTFSVPANITSRLLANAILKQAGLAKEF